MRPARSIVCDGTAATNSLNTGDMNDNGLDAARGGEVPRQPRCIVGYVVQAANRVGM